MQKIFWSKIYSILPKPIQDFSSFVLIRYITPLINYGPLLLIDIVEYKVSSLLCSSEKYQMYRFRSLIKYAKKKVPFYKRLFDQLGLSYNDFNKYEDLENIPVLSKEDLRQNFDNLISIDYLSKKNGKIIFRNSKISTTTGSTGIPTRILLSNKTLRMKFIRYVDFVSKCGCKTSDWHIIIDAVIFIKEGFKDKYNINHIYKEINFSVHANKKEDFNLLLGLIVKYKPRYIRAMPSYMYELACFAKKNNIDVNIKSIISDRENLYNYQKKKIKSVFRSKILNVYSNVEFTVSSDGKEDIEVQNNYGIMEFVDNSGKSIAEKEISKIIGTSFWNRAMPLIRYDTGDIGKYSKNKDGKKFIDSVEGRLNECIIINGRYLSPVFLNTVTDNFQNISQCQYVYDSNNITLRIIEQEPLTKQEYKELHNILSKIVGFGIKVKIKKVKYLYKGPGNKFPLIINNENNYSSTYFKINNIL